MDAEICTYCGNDRDHDAGCPLADAHMTKEQVIQAIENHVGSGIDTYVFMRFREGHSHLASKDLAMDEATADVADWLGLSSYTPPVTFNGEQVTPDDGDMLARSDYRRFLADPEVITAWRDSPDQRAHQCPICHGQCIEHDADEMLDPRAITSADLKTMVMQEDDDG